MIFLMSGRNPMSSMRSASSKTKVSIFDSLIVPLSAWSSSRPGVATTMPTPLLNNLICGSILTPP